MNALIIDDDHDLSMLLKAILSTSIPSVVCASTLESGREFASRLKPDIIFLDNNLPDGQGLNNIGDLKAMLPDTSLVMITAMGNSRDIALQSGADIFLEKPLTSSNIHDVLNKVSTRLDSQV
jgi:DNA-binding response OmpR family regulator